MPRFAPSATPEGAIARRPPICTAAMWTVSRAHCADASLR
eukprot:gene32791-15433_t